MKRKLVIERPFLARPDTYAILAAIIKGSITQDELALAFLKLEEKFPLLNSHVEIDKNHHAWFVSNENSGFPLRVKEINEENEWIYEVIQEYESGFSLKKGPLIRFVLLKNKNDSILVISANHGLIDGVSIIFLLHYILEYLTNPNEPTIPEITLPLHELLPIPIKLSLSHKIINKAVKLMWRNREKKGMRFVLEDYEKCQSKFCPELGKDLQILAFSLDEHQTSNFISKCKQEHVSVNSAICAAFIKADHEVQKKGRSTLEEISIPIDIRDVLSLPHEAIGFYISSIDLVLKYEKTLDFWDFARRSHEEIRKNMNTQNILNLLGRVLDVPEQVTDAAFFAKYGYVKDWFLDLCLKTTKMDKINYAYSISNVGKFDFPKKYGELELQKVYCHTHGSVVEKHLAAITIGDELTFCLSFLSSVIDKETVEKIKEIALNYLVS